MDNSTGSQLLSDSQLRLFVTVVTLRVLNKTGSIKYARKDTLINLTPRLVNQILAGLHVRTGCCPDVAMSKKVAKALLKDLNIKFEWQTRYQILMEDQNMEAAIVKCFQTHLQMFFDRFGKKGLSRKDIIINLAMTICTALYAILITLSNGLNDIF
ncbi:hypothetical protein F2P81_020761 [Scophthalmus maximus]|uniref:Uncharacterized protein n=1 Tax=Scophthalmus maximus TaxID=52904 RepID=A0A6A4S647_SCOMX|nr:hypothetical protein F2P81_020761 [Scophthalmus maximus]